MAKKIFWNGKKVRRDKLTENEQLLESLLVQEKKITAKWYARISGQVPWQEGERERINAEMDEVTALVNRMVGLEELRGMGCQNLS